MGVRLPSLSCFDVVGSHWDVDLVSSQEMDLIFELATVVADGEVGNAKTRSRAGWPRSAES